MRVYMKCSFCGNEITGDSQFCPFCGNKMESAVQTGQEEGEFCQYCGTFNPSDSVFCAGCGRDLTGLPEIFEEDGEGEKQGGRGLRNALIVFLAVLVLALIGGGAFWFLRSSREEEGEETRTERRRDREKDEDDEENDRFAKGEQDGDSDDEDLDNDELENRDKADGDGEKDTAAKKESDTEKEQDRSKSDTEKQTEVKRQNTDYILPNSASATLTSADISGLSLQELNYARNEIFARHGRKFSSRELQDYFNSKSWYNGTIEPADFDANYMDNLSNVEKSNIELLKNKEYSISNSGYKLDQ